jgi:hypothetical protein
MTIIDPNAEARQAKTRVAICIPCGDDVKAGFAFDLASMVGATAHNMPDVELRMFMGKSSILPLGRHRLVEDALAGGATHILWLDSDMRFPKHTLFRLLAHQQPVIGCNYPTRAMPVQPVTHADEAGNRVFTEAGAEGVESVASTGLGVMLVDADLYRQIPAPWFMVGWNAQAGSYEGEDVYFMRKVRQAGLPVLIDHGLSQDIGHIGEWEFRHEHSLAVREQMAVPEPA